MVSPYIESVLILTGINVILALGIHVPHSAGLHVLGQAGFMAVGAYTATVLTTKFSLPFIAAMLCGGGAAFIIGVLVGLPVLRVRGIYVILVTWAFGEAIRVILLNIDYLGGARGIGGIYPSTTLLIVYVIILILVVFSFRLRGSRLGRAFQALDADQDAAEAMGVDLTRTKITAFSLGASICGIGGALYAHYALYIDPSNFSFFKSVEILFSCILGGAGTFVGPIIGALIFSLIPEIFRFMSDWRVIFFGAVLIVMMIVRPQGIISRDLYISLSYFIRKRILGNRAR